MSEETDGEWCPWCKRELVYLNPWTMEPAPPEYDGACLIVHDNVYHPANMEEQPN